MRVRITITFEVCEHDSIHAEMSTNVIQIVNECSAESKTPCYFYRLKLVSRHTQAQMQSL